MSGATSLIFRAFLSTLSLRRATECPFILSQQRIISIHALLAESDKTELNGTTSGITFLSTLSLRRATGGSGVGSWRLAIFLSTLSLRRATFWQVCLTCRVEFLSTLSLRRATQIKKYSGLNFAHFYPRSPCGERQRAPSITPAASRNFYPRSPCGERRKISITVDEGTLISIHALLAESDYDTSSLLKCQVKFLSTLSLRRATSY